MIFQFDTELSEISRVKDIMLISDLHSYFITYCMYCRKFIKEARANSLNSPDQNKKCDRRALLHWQLCDYDYNVVWPCQYHWYILFKNAGPLGGGRSSFMWKKMETLLCKRTICICSVTRNLPLKNCVMNIICHFLEGKFFCSLRKGYFYTF